MGGLSDRRPFKQSRLDGALDMVDRATVLDVEVSPLNGPEARRSVPAAALESLACDLEGRGGIFDAQVVLIAEFHSSPRGQ